jgi:hypothetical protein
MASIIWLVGNLVVNSVVKELVAPTKPTMNIIFIINNYFHQEFFYILLYVEFSSLDLIKYLIKIFQRFKEILTNKLDKLRLFDLFTYLDLFDYIVETILSDSIEISRKWININCKECVVGNMKC